MTKALVLSGGGPVGIAWQTGLAAGLRRKGVDLSAADLVVGTSAGSAVGAQIALGRDMEAALGRYEEAFRRSGGPAAEAPATGSGTPPAASSSAGPTGAGAAPGGAMAKLMELMAKAAVSEAAPEEVRAEIGRFALEAETGPEERFVDAFRYLAGEAWPARYRTPRSTP
jgi:NTE family protein